jgi:hypothetical protein
VALRRIGVCRARLRIQKKLKELTDFKKQILKNRI